MQYKCTMHGFGGKVVILRRLEFHFCAIDFDVTIETKRPTAVQPRTCDFRLN